MAQAHSCDRELRAFPGFSQFRCQPEVFSCSCGLFYVHVCDEAEGCSWVLSDLPAPRQRPSHGASDRDDTDDAQDVVEQARPRENRR